MTIYKTLRKIYCEHFLVLKLIKCKYRGFRFEALSASGSTDIVGNLKQVNCIRHMIVCLDD